MQIRLYQSRGARTVNTLLAKRQYFWSSRQKSYFFQLFLHFSGRKMCFLRQGGHSAKVFFGQDFFGQDISAKGFFGQNNSAKFGRKQPKYRVYFKRQNIVLKNFILKILYYLISWRSGIAGAFDWIYGYRFCSWDNIFS